MAWWVPKLKDPVWQNIGELTTVPLDTYSPTRLSMGTYMPDRRNKPKPDVRTVIHRMAYLVDRTTVNVSRNTVMIAKWFLSHIDQMPLTRNDKEALQLMRQRLRRNVIEYEGWHGEIDPTPFTRLVDQSGYGDDVVFYGPPVGANSLGDFIDIYGWRQQAVPTI